LPVLITTDSILHALHRSYDALLAEVETTWFAASMMEILGDCHSELERMHRARPSPPLGESLRDVDLFLTVARNLFAGAGAPASGPDPRRDGDEWKGELWIHSVFGQDEEVRIPVREEKVNVSKDAVVTEEVKVGKRVVQDTEQVTGQVRKEEVKVEQKGDVDVRTRDTGKKSN
jgi:uncharacterized protein DUF3160/uncharacterized protein DUF2382